MNKIESSVLELLNKKPFYAHFFLNSRIEYDNPKYKTAAVGVNGYGVRFYFNWEFINGIAVDNVCAVIEHEVLHCLFDHILESRKEINRHNANIAMDCSINQMIENLPDGVVTLKSLSDQIGKALKPNQDWEYYYREIKQFAQANPDKCTPSADGSGEGDIEGETLDQHEWLESSQPLTDVEKAEARAAVRASFEKAVKAAKGVVPSNIQSLLDHLKGEATLPWRQILGNFVAKCRSSRKIPTRTKRNRRFGLTVPGFKVKRELNLSVCTDSSGSVSDQDFVKFINEIERISPMCSQVNWIDADCTVQDVVRLKKKRPEYKRKGGGGTAYQPAIDKAISLKSDAIIYFGDFDCADTPKNPGIPFLWVGVGQQNPPAEFGGVIRLT